MVMRVRGSSAVTTREIPRQDDAAQPQDGRLHPGAIHPTGHLRLCRPEANCALAVGVRRLVEVEVEHAWLAVNIWSPYLTLVASCYQGVP
jgi:hypothetical protein